MAWEDRPYARGQRGFGFPTSSKHSVAFWIIVANVAVFFLDGFFSRMVHGVSQLVQMGGPLTNWGQFSVTDGVMHFQIWRFFTYQFLHDGFWHLFGNMLVLFFFGAMVEGFWGTKRFVVFYLACGLGGVVLYLLLFAMGLGLPAEHVPFLIVGSVETGMIGASACVFGVLIAAWRVAPDATVLLFFIVPIKLRVLIIILLLAEVYAVMVGGFNAGGSAAHLGGAAVGYLLMAKPHWLRFAERFDGSQARRFKDNLDRRRSEHRRKLSLAEEAEVDRILAKVKSKGLQSLSEKEKKILQRATDRQQGVG